MGRLFLTNLEGNLYSCKHCHAHLALADDIISRKCEWRDLLGGINGMREQSFHSKHGKAYLFDKAVNVTIGEKEERLMMTGMHTVVDIFCVGCGSLVGWKYEAAFEKSQKYKEGKYILERFKVLGPDGSPYVFSQDGQFLESDTDDG